MATYEFKKRWLNAEHSLYQIEYWQYEQFQKVVNEDKPLYRDWVTAGNTPEEIEYVEPPAPPVVPDWTKFRHDLKASTTFGKLAQANLKPLVASALMDALRQNDIDDLRTFAAMVSAQASLTEDDEAEVNTLASNNNIGAIFA